MSGCVRDSNAMYLIIIALVSLYFLHVYMKSINRFCKSNKKLNGKTVLVTGGTCGVGFQTATEFAKRGAKIIIACPFEEEGINAKKCIEDKTDNKNVHFKLLDLSCLKSVRKFAADILESENRLDILVNNAGVGVPGDFATADGLNFIMQVNYYGHFLLTLLLLPLLKKTGTSTEPSRIINLSSIMHRIATTDVTKYNKTGYFWFHFIIYSNSKFSLILFARELSKKLKDTNVVVNCVDPGTVATGIYSSVNKVFGVVAYFIIDWFSKNQWEGAQTTLHAALDEQAGKVNGELFVNCQLSRARSLAYNDEKAQLFWNDSVKLVRLSDDELKHILS